jgi:cytochrome c peroxidase
MKKLLLISFLCALITVLISCLAKEGKTAVQQTVQQYQSDIGLLAVAVDELVQAVETSSIRKLQNEFKKSRLAYKKVEWLATYYNSYTAKQINGPALSEVEPDAKNIIIQPEGFQVIEELIFPTYDDADKPELLQQAKILRSNIKRLQVVAETLETTDAHVFDALRLQVFRIITLGISGFDSPIASNSIPEAIASLQSITACLMPYTNSIELKSKPVADGLKESIAGAISFLSVAKDFASLDRMKLITNYLNPVSQNIVDAQKALDLRFFTEPRALKATAPTLFADSVFNPDFYVPDASAWSNKDKIILGEKLFYNAILSDGGKRSCASCHNPKLAFTDGKKVADALSGKATLKRNTPTLINAGLQPFLFYDMRVSFLEDQAAEVIQNRDEMHGDFTKAINQLNKDAGYKALFKAAYGDALLTEHQIKNALASYIRSLTLFTTPFDNYMRGNKAVMTAQQVDGFNLFMGKAKCGTCHFAPVFSGVNPPDFGRMDAETIGVPSTPDTLHATLDSDEGKYFIYQIPLHRFAFKTPTLRNIAVTAPYMHNGVYKTLEEVIHFYDRGGGRGLGLKVNNQTLPEERLHLSTNEKKAIIAFLHSLTDERFAVKQIISR